MPQSVLTKPGLEVAVVHRNVVGLPHASAPSRRSRSPSAVVDTRRSWGRRAYVRLKTTRPFGMVFIWYLGLWA
jgi:hypothetical protein